MGSQESEQLLTLLQELAFLRQQDKKYLANPREAGRKAFEERQLRHDEIAREIKAVAEQKRISR